MPFSITFEYIPGSQNVVSDALSRYPILSRHSCLTLVAPQLMGLVSHIALAAKQDPDYQRLLRSLDSLELSSSQEGDSGVAASAADDGVDAARKELCDLQDVCRSGKTPWKAQDSVIFSEEGQILLPKEDELRILVISEAYDSPLGGHFGQAKTLEKVWRFWRWKGLSQDVKDYVASCPLCQHMKHSMVKARGLLKPILAERPWQMVTMDLVGKFAPSAGKENTHCLVIIDKFSKFVLLKAVPETLTSEQTAEIFLR